MIAYIYCIVTIVLFSTIEIVGKLIGNNISPYAITAWRFFIGGLVLLPLALNEQKKNKMHLAMVDLGKIAMAGVLNVCISMLLLQLSVYYGKAGLSAVIVSTNPIFVVMIASLILKEKINSFHIIGIVLGVAGLFLIIMGEWQIIRHSRSIMLGIIYGLAAALTFGIYTVYTKKLISTYGNLFTLSLTFLSGSIILLGYTLFFSKGVGIHLKLSNILYMTYLGLFVTGIAYVLYFKAIQEIGANNASIFFFLKPAIASILAWSLNNEHLRSIQIIGIVIIMFSLASDLIRNLLKKVVET